MKVMPVIIGFINQRSSVTYILKKILEFSFLYAFRFQKPGKRLYYILITE